MIPSRQAGRLLGLQGRGLVRLISNYAASPRPSTLDSDSVSHFSRLSAHWWNPVGEFSLLHAMNPIRLDFMRQKLLEVGEWDESRSVLLAKRGGQDAVAIDRPWEKKGRWLSGVKALDVGCGGGLLSESLARVGADVLGIDASASNVEIARLHASKDPGYSAQLAGPKYRHIMAEELLAETGPEQFDIVCAMEVIEHVASPRLFLRSLADMVKPGGHLFMSTIARTPLSYFLTITMAETVLRLVTPGTHRHDQYINPSELVEHFSTDIPWIHPQAPTEPHRMQYETRGAFYVPGLGKWYLASRGMDKYGSEQANYFFWVRKPR